MHCAVSIHTITLLLKKYTPNIFIEDIFISVYFIRGRKGLKAFLNTYHRFPWYATFQIKTPAETFPKFPSIILVIPYMEVLDWAWKFKIWRPVEVTCKHGGKLFVKFALASIVYLLVQGFTVERVARLLHVGKTFVKKIRNLYQNTKTVHYQSRPGRVRKLEGIKVSLRFELRFL